MEHNNYVFLKVEGVALGVIGYLLMSHFCFPKTTGEICQCWYDETSVLPRFPITSRTTPGTFGDRQVEIISRLVSILAAFQRKSGLVRV
jgi:hypothetical protein